AIMKVTLAANELKAQGRDIIVLGAGELDFDTPENIKEAGYKAIRDGVVKYTPGDGITKLREAIRDKFKRENGLDYTIDEITVVPGGKQVIFNAMMATVGPGDEVIVPAPYWLSYADIVRFAGATPVFIPCSDKDGFRLTPAALE